MGQALCWALRILWRMKNFCPQRVYSLQGDTSIKQLGDSKINCISEADLKSGSSFLTFMTQLIKVSLHLLAQVHCSLEKMENTLVRLFTSAGDLWKSWRMQKLLEAQDREINIFRLSKRLRCNFYEILTSRCDVNLT